MLQPDVGRCGGLTESIKIAKFSQEHNRIIVPHCWKTSVSISATAHFAFNTPNCAFVEYLPPQLCVEILRKELATEVLILLTENKASNKTRSRHRAK